ncbi:CLK4-associating serine/arginine rich protein-like isoform X3 [Rattus rattus]|uniref:CLK4-associating serine/arginine rich protein-like isoform X3 n=1 Tax=Rattus rattus TaxID=10117 RepID=UPI0013F38DDE|nr:CLK4-associating serine/arginine rich protein-like isoform X3 [Rattus rattus]
MLSEDGSGRGARRSRVDGGVRSGPRAAAASASRAGRAPDGRRRRRGLRAGDRVGPGGGSPRAAPANRVAGFRARSLARRHAHTRGRSGEGAEPAERQIPARCESPGQGLLQCSAQVFQCHPPQDRLDNSLANKVLGLQQIEASRDSL